MDKLLLSRISKDFLNLDSDVVPGRERYRMGWSGSVLVSPKEDGKKLIELRERFAGLFRGGKVAEVELRTGPKLKRPLDAGSGSLRPAWYFYRGKLEEDKKKNPDPIAYLLTETNETAKARPVPGNSMLLRSICKGKGVLKQNGKGLVYLDIDNLFILGMLPFLKAQGLVRPPYFNLFGAPEGAHVPVIPAREVAFQFLDHVAEVGQEFTFEIEGLYSMEPVSWPEVEQVWFFRVKSEELEKLRRRYFLPSVPGGHAFHIAVAVKPRVVGAMKSLPVMRVNPAFIAA